jgi:TonB family protein
LHTVNYRCVTYTIVDQHLYRLVAYATGEDTIPPDYEAAVRVISELTFEPVDRSSLRTAGAAAGLLKMPHAQISSSVDFYPPSAKLRGVEGVVDLEYGIDGKGHVRDLRGTYSASQTLQDAAQALLRSTTFQVKPNWEADDYQKLRFTTEVQFWLGRCPRNFPARTVGAEVITICDSVRPR